MFEEKHYIVSVMYKSSGFHLHKLFLHYILE